VVDVASRYKEVEPLTDKSATEVAAALGPIYKRGPLNEVLFNQIQVVFSSVEP